MALAAATLGGCGFQPLYGGRTAGAYDPGLAAIKVAPIPDRAGQILAMSLRNALNPRGVDAPQPYTLHTSLTLTRNDLGFQLNNTTVRGQIDAVAVYTLTADNGVELLHGRSHTVSGFNIVQDGYTTQVAADDARDRALGDIGDEMVLNLSLFVRNHRAAAN
jgi:LPS-assembly lipoprotein